MHLDNKRSSATVDGQAPAGVAARISNQDLAAGNISAAKFVAIKSAADLGNQTAIVSAFSAGDASSVEKTGGVVVTVTPTPYPYTPIQKTPVQTGIEPFPVQNPIVVKGGTTVVENSCNVCWNFRPLHAIGGFLRELVSVTVDAIASINTCNVCVCDACATMVQSAPIYNVQGVQYGYQYSNSFNNLGYTYYVYPGQACGQNTVNGKWMSDGSCVIPASNQPGQVINTGCAAGQYLWNSQCVATCPTGTSIYGNQCATLSCPTGQYLWNMQCVTSCPKGTTLSGAQCL